MRTSLRIMIGRSRRRASSSDWRTVQDSIDDAVRYFTWPVLCSLSLGYALIFYLRARPPKLAIQASTASLADLRGLG